MHFFKKMTKIKNTPLLIFIEMGGLISFSIWHFHSQWQEKRILQENNLGKKIVVRPSKGPLGHVWKYTIENTDESSETKKKP